MKKLVGTIIIIAIIIAGALFTYHQVIKAGDILSEQITNMIP